MKFLNFVYSIVKKIMFLKGKLCIHCMWIFHSRFIPFEIGLSTLVWGLFKLNNFCHVLRQLTLTAWTDLPASWCYASCFQVLICGFLNIIVWEIISLSVVCSFIVNKIAQNTMWGWDYSIQIELFYMWCFSHYIHHFCEDVGTSYRTFTFRFSFWAHFDTQLMNIIWKYV